MLVTVIPLLTIVALIIPVELFTAVQFASCRPKFGDWYTLTPRPMEIDGALVAMST
jgi:hypothetical protein